MILKEKYKIVEFRNSYSKNDSDKMKQVKIKCRECDCRFLTFGIKKKIRRYKTLIHTFTKRIEDKTNNSTDKNSNNDNNNNNNNNNNNDNNNKNDNNNNNDKNRKTKIYLSKC